MDDDPRIEALVRKVFPPGDIELYVEREGDPALRTLREERPAAAAVSVALASESGLALLRERLEDIPVLVDFFISQFAAQYGKKVVGISPEALDLLLSQPWEGNIRELRNAVSSAVLLGSGDVLTPDDFAQIVAVEEDTTEPDELCASILKILQPRYAALCSRYAGCLFDTVTADTQKALVCLSLSSCGGNQVTAARLLGISRNTLRERIERFRLNHQGPPRRDTGPPAQPPSALAQPPERHPAV